MTSGDGWLSIAGGIKLFRRWWRPTGQARGAIVIAHGLRDHSGRYNDIAGRLVERGWSIHAADLRGHALSVGGGRLESPVLVHVADLKMLVQDVRRRGDADRIFLWGHSIGGTIAAKYLTTSEMPPVDGCILTSAALGWDPQSYVFVSPRGDARLPPIDAFPSLAVQNFTSVPELFKSLVDDPLTRIGSPIMASTLADTIEHVRARADAISLPILLAHGDADRVSPVAGARQFYLFVRSASRQIDVVSGGHHFIHENDAFTGILKAWLDAR